MLNRNHGRRVQVTMCVTKSQEQHYMNKITRTTLQEQHYMNNITGTTLHEQHYMNTLSTNINNPAKMKKKTKNPNCDCES